MKIAVDAMGGDFAPGVVIEGLVSALIDFPDYHYTLVGSTPKVLFDLEKYGIAGDPRIELVNAPTVCEMSEPSAVSLRAKKDLPFFRKIMYNCCGNRIKDGGCNHENEATDFCASLYFDAGEPA